MKISKKTREEAALICAVAASNEASFPPCPYYSDVANALGLDYSQDGWSRDSVMLAVDAWQHVLSNTTGAWRWRREHDAEAECLLRTGWTPGGAA